MKVFLFALSLALAACGTPQAAPSRLPDFTDLVENEGPAVVNVITAAPAPAARDPFEFFRRFMPDLPEPPQGPRRRQGLGSGFIISADGYVLTNAHVVEGADEVTVRMADAKREFKAKVVGADRRTDVALLKVDATGLPTVEIGRSTDLRPGEWVVAIGSPFGFSNTVTAGIVSATERALPAETYVPFIQTDVAVNPGNSGGPLLDLEGKVVGINSQIYSRTGGYMGVSFAIPIETAMRVADQLREHGRVTRGRLGIAIQPVTAELATSFGLDAAKGVLVASVEPGTPAERAGLQAGDVILAYDGEALDSVNELPRAVAGTKPGTEVKLRIWRQGKAREIAATIGQLEGEPVASGGQNSSAATLGLALRELAPQEKKRLGVGFGLAVTGVGEGPASATMIRAGDVIVAINQDRFASLEEFKQLLRRHEGETVALLVRRGEAALFVPVEVG
ncbi:MAG: DegQ family serine endoprotease [Betaproteobacteria bacterium]